MIVASCPPVANSSSLIFFLKYELNLLIKPGALTLEGSFTKVRGAQLRIKGTYPNFKDELRKFLIKRVITANITPITM